MFQQICKVIIFYLSICVVLVLGACSNNSLPKPKPVPKFKNIEKINLDWSINSLLSGSNGSFIPTLDGGAIFTADKTGLIIRVDQSDGVIIKKIHLKRKLSSGTVTSSDSIFVTSEDGYLLSINKVSGDINWQVQLPTMSIEAPQISGNIIVIKTNDAELLAYNANNGGLIWVYQNQIPALTLRAYNTFQIVGNDVVVDGQPGGKLALINLNTGIPIWENYIAIPDGATELDKLTDIAMRPVIVDKEICVSSYNGKLVCLDALSNIVSWSYKYSSASGILIDEQNIYAVSTDGIVNAFDRITGLEIWKNDILQNRILNAPIFYKNNVLVIDNEGFLNLFSCYDGKLISRQSSYLRDGISYPLVNDHQIYIQSGNGYLTKIVN